MDTIFFLALLLLTPTPEWGVKHTKGCNVFGVACAGTPVANPKTTPVHQ